MTRLAHGLGNARVRAFGGQVFWTLSSRVVASLLQVVVIAQLARALPPSQFALVSTANVVMMAVPAINGFGLIRQMQYRRSRQRDDPQLPSLFTRRLRYSYLSAAIWLASCVLLWLVTGEGIFAALSPAAIWLLTEQTTQVWNGLSIVDKRAQVLMSSFLWRRTPVILCLLVAELRGLDPVWSWTVGLAVGACLAWVNGRRSQEAWARIVWPRKSLMTEKTDLDFGFWWSQLGNQVRDLDVPVLSVIDPGVAGIYALPARLIRPMNLITMSAGSVAFPILSRRDHVRGRHLFLGVVLASVPTTLVATTLAILAPFLPHVVGAAYAASVRPMQLMCITAVVWSPSILLAIFMQSRGARATRVVGKLSFSTNLLQVVAAAAGALFGGATGAAAFTLVTQMLTLVVTALFASRWVSTERDQDTFGGRPTSAERIDEGA